MAHDYTLEQAFVRVTEKAAIAAAQTMGLGDRDRTDGYCGLCRRA